jgi:hypothetical protein
VKVESGVLETDVPAEHARESVEKIKITGVILRVQRI